MKAALQYIEMETIELQLAVIKLFVTDSHCPCLQTFPPLSPPLLQLLS